MPCPPAGITDRDWAATPPAVKALVMRLMDQLEALSARVAQLEEQKGQGLIEVIQIPAPGLILATPKAPINL
jgi:hypothetical protein